VREKDAVIIIIKPFFRVITHRSDYLKLTQLKENNGRSMQDVLETLSRMTEIIEKIYRESSSYPGST